MLWEYSRRKRRLERFGKEDKGDKGEKQLDLSNISIPLSLNDTPTKKLLSTYYLAIPINSLTQNSKFKTQNYYPSPSPNLVKFLSFSDRNLCQIIWYCYNQLLQ